MSVSLEGATTGCSQRDTKGARDKPEEASTTCLATGSREGRPGHAGAHFAPPVTLPRSLENSSRKLTCWAAAAPLPGSRSPSADERIKRGDANTRAVCGTAEAGEEDSPGLGVSRGPAQRRTLAVRTQEWWPVPERGWLPSQLLPSTLKTHEDTPAPRPRPPHPRPTLLPSCAPLPRAHADLPPLQVIPEKRARPGSAQGTASP